MKYLLDTDVCIGMIRATARKSLERLEAHKACDVFLSSIVRFELLHGVKRARDRAMELKKVENFVRQFASLAFDDNCAAEAARISAFLDQRGTKIGPYDTLIAATARAHKLTVVTRNVSEFGRVPGLPVEDWEA